MDGDGQMPRTDEKYFKRKPGRPRWTGERVSKCDIRLNKEEEMMLDMLADRYEASRSTIMRKALRDFYRFNTEK